MLRKTSEPRGAQEVDIAEKIYIFGAHSRAQTLAVYLQYLYPSLEVEAFLYDNEESNPLNVGKVPVLHLNKNITLHSDYPVYIGTRGIYHGQIIEKLKRIGFREIYPVTVELDLKLRNAYLEKYYISIEKRFLKIDRLPDTGILSNMQSRKGIQKIIQPTKCQKSARIYVARSIHDKPLRQQYMPAFYEQEIQVGAAMTEERLADEILTDDTGDNISDKNSQFCELTALYWIWKNAKEDIVGLSHYRRHFILPDDWVERMKYYDVDVILPVPLYVAPSLEGNFRMRHDSSDWDYTMRCLEENDRSTYQKATDFFKGNLYSPCNMFIMSKKALEDLCTWLFPILFKVVKHGGQKEDAYQNRYPGFISERLITFFFEKHTKKYKVVYADKNFLF